MSEPHGSEALDHDHRGLEFRVALALAVYAHRLADELVERHARLLAEIGEDAAVRGDEDVLRRFGVRIDRFLDHADGVESLR
jgi:hypothetical protein